MNRVQHQLSMHYNKIDLITQKPVNVALSLSLPESLLCANHRRERQKEMESTSCTQGEQPVLNMRVQHMHTYLERVEQYEALQ